MHRNLMKNQPAFLKWKSTLTHKWPKTVPVIRRWNVQEFYTSGRTPIKSVTCLKV